MDASERGAQRRWWWIAVPAALMVTATSAPASADPPGAAPPVSRKVSKDSERRAHEVLRGMAQKLSSARSVTVTARRELDEATARALGTPRKSILVASVLRPSRVRVDTSTLDEKPVRSFYYDGSKATVVDHTLGVHASGDMTGDIDAMADAVEDRYGFSLPLLEFLANDPAAAMADDVQEARYEGIKMMDGKPCHQLALSGNDDRARLWVAKDDELPRRLVATLKNGDAITDLEIVFTQWNLSADVSEDRFAFTPPSGYYRVEMVKGKEPNPAAPATPSEPGAPAPKQP